MNRFIWAFAAIALVLIAVVGFLLLQPTAERANYPRPDHTATDAQEHSSQLPSPAAVEAQKRR
ncbi:MAG: hypothetical protein H6839_11490 [Planctomycetes bacterium]|nr:hypothetical protein [Planctomycetota bacterium]